MRWMLPFILMLTSPAFAQNYFRDHFGGTIGIVANVGTHNTSIGFAANGYYTDYFYQFNAGTTLLLFERSLGQRRRFIESRSAIGVVLLAGKEDRTIDFDLSGLNHQTAKRYGIGYDYILYVDSRKTSQRSGGFGIHLKNLSMYHENDIFGGGGRDRFRTGQFHVSYQWEQLKFYGGVQMWTGQSSTAPLYTEGCSRCPQGYRDLRDQPYGRTSNGNAYLGVRYNGVGMQTASVSVGVDSELVRHAFQNLLIHNIGEFVKRPTPHYPMLSPEGLPVFNRKERRPDRLYLQLGANNGWWY